MEDQHKKNNAEVLDFTGERYVPEIPGNIELEHRHRYLFASQAVVGKVVLDIASGEGYGSAMLARIAFKVIGVDIAREAVLHAQAKYQAENLEFILGSCLAIPLEDASIDVVVSFETIEHHGEHELMMREIKRVLRPGGIVIISSPDKLEYSDKPGYSNTHHVKELYRDEFKKLLHSHFKNHSIYGQRVVYGSAMFCEDVSSQVSSYDLADETFSAIHGLPHAVYLVAIASDDELPCLKNGLLEQPINDSEIAKQLTSLNQTVSQQEQQLACLAPLVSIVTVNFNGLRFLQPLLSSLLAQSYPRFEILLVDNASSDQSVSFIKKNYPDVRVIESQHNLGFAGGNNLGMQAARGALIALINNDTVVDPDWLLHLTASIQSDTSIGAVGSKVLFYKPYLEFTLSAETFSPASYSNSPDTRELGVLMDEASCVAGCAYQKPVFSDGFFGKESVDWHAVRWSCSSAHFMLPFDAEAENLFLSFIAAGGKGGEGNRFTVSINDTIIGEGILEETFSEYHFSIPAPLAQSNAFNLINNAGTTLDNKANAQDRGIYQPDRGQFDVPERVSALCGTSMLIRKSALDKVGQFDSNFFMYYEDGDLSWRLRNHGYRLQYEPKSIVYHIHTGSSKEWSPFFIYFTARNSILIRFKNASWGNAMHAYLAEGAKCAIQVIRYLALWVRTATTSRELEEVSLRLRIQSSLIKQIPLAILKRFRILSD